MIDFMINIRKKLDKYVHEKFKSPAEFVQIEEDGFRVGIKCRLFGKTIISRWYKKNYWNNIKEINAWNADMYMGVEFVPYDGKHTLVFDDADNWEQFIDELPKQFTGFNMHNYDQAGYLGGGICRVGSGIRLLEICMLT